MYIYTYIIHKYVGCLFAKLPLFSSLDPEIASCMAATSDRSIQALVFEDST